MSADIWGLIRAIYDCFSNPTKCLAAVNFLQEFSVQLLKTPTGPRTWQDEIEILSLLEACKFIITVCTQLWQSANYDLSNDVISFSRFVCELCGTAANVSSNLLTYWASNKEIDLESIDVEIKRRHDQSEMQRCSRKEKNSQTPSNELQSVSALSDKKGFLSANRKQHDPTQSMDGVKQANKKTLPSLSAEIQARLSNATLEELASALGLVDVLTTPSPNDGRGQTFISSLIRLDLWGERTEIVDSTDHRTPLTVAKRFTCLWVDILGDTSTAITIYSEFLLRGKKYFALEDCNSADGGSIEDFLNYKSEQLFTNSSLITFHASYKLVTDLLQQIIRTLTPKRRNNQTFYFPLQSKFFMNYPNLFHKIKCIGTQLEASSVRTYTTSTSIIRSELALTKTGFKTFTPVFEFFLSLIELLGCQIDLVVYPELLANKLQSQIQSRLPLPSLNGLVLIGLVPLIDCLKNDIQFFSLRPSVANSLIGGLSLIYKSLSGASVEWIKKIAILERFLDHGPSKQAIDLNENFEMQEERNLRNLFFQCAKHQADMLEISNLINFMWKGLRLNSILTNSEASLSKSIGIKLLLFCSEFLAQCCSLTQMCNSLISSLPVDKSKDKAVQKEPPKKTISRSKHLKSREPKFASIGRKHKKNHKVEKLHSNVTIDFQTSLLSNQTPRKDQMESTRHMLCYSEGLPIVINILQLIVSIYLPPSKHPTTKEVKQWLLKKLLPQLVLASWNLRGNKWAFSGLIDQLSSYMS